MIHHQTPDEHQATAATRTLTALAVILVATLLAACGPGASQSPDVATLTLPPGPTIRVAALKGPTGMGLAWLASEPPSWIELSLHGTADEITPALIRGDLDMALIPANLAAVLHARTEGDIQVAAVTTLGVLHLVEYHPGDAEVLGEDDGEATGHGDTSGESTGTPAGSEEKMDQDDGGTITTLADLAGRTVLASGKGSIPQYVIETLLEQAGVRDQVTVEYRSEPTEVASALLAGQASLAILPEPYVSTVLAKSESMAEDPLRLGLDLTAEWNTITQGKSLVTAVLAVRGEFAHKYPESVDAFLASLADSVAHTNEHPGEAAPLIADQGIVPDASIAEAAIPRSHIVSWTGEEMRAAVSDCLEVLFEANPEAVGGRLPGEDFYYGI